MDNIDVQTVPNIKTKAKIPKSAGERYLVKIGRVTSVIALDPTFANTYIEESL